LPNGAERSPDAAWVALTRWPALSAEDRAKFPPLCPDFVVELRSRSDELANLRAKMEEYRVCGATLGWLIDPIERRVHVCRPGAEVETLDAPETVTGDPVLRDFVLDLRRIW
jgi:Uma2 family endonuclease